MEAHHVEVRHLTFQDMAELKSASLEVYTSVLATWNDAIIGTLLAKFPDGQICVCVDGKVVGCALSLIINYSDFGDDHSYSEITANYAFTTHDPKGDVLYGIEVFIHPEYRGLRLARRLYDVRKELCENLNLRAIVAGGRMPCYAQYSNTLSAKQYIEKVKAKELYDPVLSFQLANDFHIRKLLQGYLAGDKESMEYATLNRVGKYFLY